MRILSLIIVSILISATSHADKKITELEPYKPLFESLIYSVSNGHEVITDFAGEENLSVKIECHTVEQVCSIVKFFWGQKDEVYLDDLSFDFTAVIKLQYGRNGVANFYKEGVKIGEITNDPETEPVVLIEGLSVLEHEVKWPKFKGKVIL